MKQLLFVTAALFFLCTNVLAAEPRVLRTGDVLNVGEGVTLTRWSVRLALKEYGYTNFGPGGIQGHIIRITAFGPDKNRYELTVHWTTHEVLRVQRPRNFWY